MVRGGGRGYSRGGGGRGTSNYRGSGGSSYRGNSGRSSFGSSYSGSRGSSSGYYDRNRDRAGPSRHDRHDDHKRSYRNSSRDRSPDRKRSRHEDSRPSSSYSSSYRRNESSRSSRQTPPPPSIRSSSAPHRRDDSSHRHSSANDSMGPPKNLPPRSSHIVRRGGTSSVHRTSGRPPLRINRRESVDLRIMRKKLLMAEQRDKTRRIQIARLTSTLRSKRRGEVPAFRKVFRKPREKKDDESKKDDDDKDTDADKSKTKEGDEDDDGGEEGADEKVGEVKVKKEPKKEGKDGEEEGNEGEGSDADEDEKKADADEKDDEDDKALMTHRRPKRTYIKLTCVHCRSNYRTFREYENHLFSKMHALAMRRLALRQKTQLAKMRMNQRNAQRDIEESCKDELAKVEPQYCMLCRLNYRQQKPKHQASDAHRAMKKFLMPYCSTCHIAFKSPMVYESHRCSLDHIRLKARNSESANSESSDCEKEVDLNNFMTVDSVGEIDGDGEEKGEGEEGKDKADVGADHVKKMETMYCDLCRYYIPLKEEEESIIRKHCANRGHLKAFLRFKKMQNIRPENERRQKEAKEKKKESGEKTADGEKTNENGDENEEGGEDKIWEDVDKDLGDLLREVGPDGDHEDEEDGSVLNINIERFDRFKNSENQKKEVNGEEVNDESEEIKDEEATAEKTPTKTPKEKTEKKVETAKSEEKPAVETK